MQLAAGESPGHGQPPQLEGREMGDEHVGTEQGPEVETSLVERVRRPSRSRSPVRRQEIAGSEPVGCDAETGGLPGREGAIDELARKRRAAHRSIVSPPSRREVILHDDCGRNVAVPVRGGLTARVALPFYGHVPTRHPRETATLASTTVPATDARRRVAVSRASAGATPPRNGNSKQAEQGGGVSGGRGGGCGRRSRLDRHARPRPATPPAGRRRRPRSRCARP